MPKKKTRKDGLIEKKVTIGAKANGDPIRKSFYGHSTKDIDDKVKEYTRQAAYGTIDRKISLAEWADKWLSTYKEGNVRGNTYETTYRISVDKIKAYFRLAKLAAIRPVDIQQFFNDHTNLSQSRIDKLKITLNAIFETAIENELIIRNPVKSIRPKSDLTPEAKRAYTRDEAADLVAFAKTHKDGAAIITIIKTGLRRGELCGLKWSDIDFKASTLAVKRSVSLTHGSARIEEPKTKSSIRDIPFDEELAKVLLAIPRRLHCDFVFASQRGLMMNPDNWSKRTYAEFMADYAAHYKETHGTDPRILNPHELRHTFATFLCGASDNLDVTSKILGHSSPDITSKIYVHTSIETKQAAIAKVLPFSK